MAHGKRVVIIGAGCFGLSTAYHLLLRGYQVTVIDRSVVLPAPDAASSDLNKVVRSSYEDLYFARLARKAIQAWKDSKWDGAYKESVCFHLFAAGKDRSADRLGSRSGVITLGGGTAQGAYTTAALANDKDLGADVTEIKDEASFKSYFPLPNDSVGSFSYDLGYVNRDGGWANATKAVTLLLNEVRGLGGDVHGGTEVSGLRSDTGGRVIGVELVSGDTLNGDIVVVATGAWTPSLFPDQGLQTKLLATG
jgi:sarcosine oxidase/L-pipecolate oxidase